MITREEAEALAGAAAEHAEVLARTVVALYDERDAEVAHRRQAHDEADRLRDDARHESETLRRLLNEAHELTMATILERDAARAEVAALRENQRGALAAIQATAESAEKYAAKADALALELRRLRAAEAPGTDDAAFEGTGWTSKGTNPDTSQWVHPSGARLSRFSGGWFNLEDFEMVARVALDAMRAAVPGSV